MLHLPTHAVEAIAAHALACFPLEMCGLVVGPTPADADGAAPSVIDRFVPCENLAASSRVYTLNPKQHLRIDRDAEDGGLAVVGVVHSHTHTEPYPSPTDIAQAIDPAWHYLIVSLRDAEPMLRSWRIVDGEVTEEPIVVVSGA